MRRLNRVPFKVLVNVLRFLLMVRKKFKQHLGGTIIHGLAARDKKGGMGGQKKNQLRKRSIREENRKKVFDFIHHFFSVCFSREQALANGFLFHTHIHTLLVFPPKDEWISLFNTNCIYRVGRIRYNRL